MQFEVKMVSDVPKKKSRIVKIGDNLYDDSGGLEEYRNGFVVKQIDGRDDYEQFCGQYVKMYSNFYKVVLE